VVLVIIQRIYFNRRATRCHAQKISRLNRVVAKSTFILVYNKFITSIVAVIFGKTRAAKHGRQFAGLCVEKDNLARRKQSTVSTQRSWSQQPKNLLGVRIARGWISLWIP
jgi:hypothetical protein